MPEFDLSIVIYSQIWNDTAFLHIIWVQMKIKVTLDCERNLSIPFNSITFIIHAYCLRSIRTQIHLLFFDRCRYLSVIVDLRSPNFIYSLRHIYRMRRMISSENRQIHVFVSKSWIYPQVILLEYDGDLFILSVNKDGYWLLVSPHHLCDLLHLRLDYTLQKLFNQLEWQ